MSIEEFLKKSSTSKITNEDKWLYWDEDTDNWVVLQRGYYERSNNCFYRGDDICLYRGDDISEALKKLAYFETE